MLKKRGDLVLIIIFISVLVAVPFSGPSDVFAIEGYPGATWGRLHSEIDGLNGNGATGFINQGIDWVDLYGVRFNTFLEYRYRLRTKNEEFYNAAGPAVGFALKKKEIRIGADYFWERFTDLDRTDRKATVFIEWYVDWDLKKR